MMSRIMEVSVLLSEVPSYLCLGQLYETFEHNEDHTTGIQVPHNVLKATTDIKSIRDLIHLLRSIRYWLVDDVPLEVVEYILESTESFCCETEISEFISSFPVLQCLSDLRKLQYWERLNMSILSPYKEVFPKLLDLGYEPNLKSCEYAAQAGDLSLLQQLIAMDAYISSNVLGEAVKYGHLHIVQYLRSISCPEKGDLRTLAARYGRPHILQYLHEHTTHRLHISFLFEAIRGGHLSCLIYLCEHGCPWNADNCTAAARAGHIECLAYLHEHGCPWNQELCNFAAEDGQLQAIIYAHEHGCPWSRRLCIVAAEQGNLAILAYAHEHGCPWDTYAPHGAAMKGHLHCLQYCFENGCPGNENTCSIAAACGHLDCLRYLHEQGCPWNDATTRLAAEKSHLSCLHYAHEHGCDMSWAEKHSSYTRLVQQGVDTACLDYIQQHYRHFWQGTVQDIASTSNYILCNFVSYALICLCVYVSVVPVISST